MIQTISITNLRKNIFDIFAKLEKRGDEILVEKDGKKIISIKPYFDDKTDWDKYIKYQIMIDSDIRGADWTDLKNVRKNFDNKIKGW